MLIVPNWPAPAAVKAVTTTREGGCSVAPYQGFNLGLHVGDDSNAVADNRATLQQVLGLSDPPAWLNQVHGTTVLSLTQPLDHVPDADGSFTEQPGLACTVMTADCLPVLLCDKAGTAVAAVHAGWRGLVDGIIEQAVARFSSAPDELMAWLGPAIGPDAFEVGGEVRAQFIAHDPAAATAFVAIAPSANDKWLADLYQLATQRLQAVGVKAVYGGEHCTFSEPSQFYSYRRDGVTGRQASLIWLERDQ